VRWLFHVFGDYFFRFTRFTRKKRAIPAGSTVAFFFWRCGCRLGAAALCPPSDAELVSDFNGQGYTVEKELRR
jgi:hypothetical protein